MKCRNCGAELKYGKCEYCGSDFREDVPYIVVPKLEIPEDRLKEILRQPPWIHNREETTVFYADGKVVEVTTLDKKEPIWLRANQINSGVISINKESKIGVDECLMN